jgi:hypothetical protein
LPFTAVAAGVDSVAFSVADVVVFAEEASVAEVVSAVVVSLIFACPTEEDEQEANEKDIAIEAASAAIFLLFIILILIVL